MAQKSFDFSRFFCKKGLTNRNHRAIIVSLLSERDAGVAQLVEQLICNQQVGGSNPSTSSNATVNKGEFPSGQRGQTVNLLSLTSLVRIQLPPPTKNALLSTDKGAIFE